MPTKPDASPLLRVPFKIFVPIKRTNLLSERSSACKIDRLIGLACLHDFKCMHGNTESKSTVASRTRSKKRNIVKKFMHSLALVSQEMCTKHL